MKLVVAFIQPFMLGNVVAALRQLPGFTGMTVTHAAGLGASGSTRDDASIHVVEDFIDLAKKTRVEVLTGDEVAVEVVQAIKAAAHTGHAGDGKVIVLSLEDVADIRSK